MHFNLRIQTQKIKKLESAISCVYLEFVRAFGQLSLDPLPLSGPGHELLKLDLHLLPLVFGLHLCLLQTLHIAGQLFVLALQDLLVLLQVDLELCRATVLT